jgi:hypothetical protein
MQPSFTNKIPLPKHHRAKSKNSPLFQKLDHTFPKMDIFKNVLFSKTTPTFFSMFYRYSKYPSKTHQKKALYLDLFFIFTPFLI